MKTKKHLSVRFWYTYYERSRRQGRLRPDNSGSSAKQQAGFQAVQQLRTAARDKLVWRKAVTRANWPISIELLKHFSFIRRDPRRLP